MKLNVALLPQQIPSGTDRRNSVAVAIDVLRATTVMTTASENGAAEIVTFASVEDARKFSARSDKPSLLCGERQCKRVEGFDLGNSPAEYPRSVVADRRMILSTTNGTAAIEAARDFGQVIVSSFLNLDATIRHLSDKNSVCLICAGTNGEITLEDTLLAGAIAHRLKETTPTAECNDGALIAHHSWLHFLESGESLGQFLKRSQGGRNLIRVGYEQDIERCAHIDVVDCVPERIRCEPPTFGPCENR